MKKTTPTSGAILKALIILGWVSSKLPENIKEKIKKEGDFKYKKPHGVRKA